MYLRDTIVVDMRLLGCGDMLRAYRLYIVYHTCGALSREFFYRLAVGLLSAAGTRMPWHPAPSRAFWLYLQYRLLMTCSRLISYVFYKETALGLWGLYWLSQCGIPHRTCRFYLLLAGAPKDEGEGLCGAPLLHPLDSTSSPRGYPLRRGITAAAGLCQYWIPVSGAIVNPQFRIWFGCLCSVLYRSRFSRVVGLVSLVFHYWGRGCLCLRLRWVWLWSIVGFALTASGSIVLFGNVTGWSVSLVA